MNIREFLTDKVQAAMTQAGIPAEYSAHVAASKKAGFGDYQANGAMAAAKAMKTNPRELAAKIVEHLDLEGIAEQVEIAGPGFINIHLNEPWLAGELQQCLGESALSVDKTTAPQTVVVDYSSPNLAKEMHVGHLRSTIIGDAIVKALEFVGHTVVRQNHVGDWGTQFGMLVAELESQAETTEAGIALKDLEAFYQRAKKHFDEDPEFATTAREYVVRLQSGDTKVLALWQQFREISLSHGEEIYNLLNVSLTRANVMGESAYNEDLPVLVAELEQQGLAVVDQGAKVVFLPELADKAGNPSVVIVQKQDGGYLYATTDLACIRYRVGKLKGDRLMYFIDQRQGLHMQQVFALARKAGFVGPEVSLEHHGFGTMNGEDGTPFKTRDGGTVKLAQLLVEAVDRARALIDSKGSDLPDSEKAEVARKVGIGAVKYADLSKTRTTDYIFSWEKMLSFEGNTAPYLQYAYTRIQSIFRNANVDPASLDATLVITEPQERQLAMKLLQFPETIELMVKEAFPHVLCSYLFELASLYMSFYESCPILKDGVKETTRDSRLQLCRAVAEHMQLGLSLLGIEVMDRM
ncbi:arginine--tRNA ligase [Halioxenophilus sp. WMMB6]|uniref:arginine--tRNA ligase n=1 Tax=Halioxenophilus sp. WMMB6 TaxID=3073815 RepID=UPI00295F2031|nr:arginine--tRNA ligase [Halioxenophilus sp. WMMB6]